MEEKYSTEKINNALYKKAIGYEAKEITEEYVVDETGEIKLNKKKVTKKHVSPDLTAAKLLLDKFSIDDDELEDMTDEELYQEKLRLLNLLDGI